MQLTALLNIVTLLPAVMMPLLAVFYGDNAVNCFSIVSIIILWISMVVSYSGMGLFLKKERKLAGVIALAVIFEILFTAAGVMIHNSLLSASEGASEGPYSKVFMVAYAISLAAGIILMLWWKFGDFRENLVVRFGQIMIFLTLLNLLAEETLMNVRGIFAVLLILTGADFAMNMARNNRAKGAAAAAGAVILGIIWGIANLLETPVVFAFNKLGIVVQKMAVVFGAVLARVVGFLFGRGIHSIDQNMSGGAGGGDELLEFEESAGRDHNLFRYMFYFAVLAVTLWLAFLLIRFIIRKIFSIRLGGIRVSALDNSREPIGFLESIRAFLRKIRAEIRLKSHPNSVAAVLYRLEKKYRHNDELARKPEETPREFLTRLAEDAMAACETEAVDETALARKKALLAFADEVDLVCYGREKNWLKKSAAGLDI